MWLSDGVLSADFIHRNGFFRYLLMVKACHLLELRILTGTQARTLDSSSFILYTVAHFTQRQSPHALTTVSHFKTCVPTTTCADHHPPFTHRLLLQHL